jgi:uncharacterized protein (TIGR03086 family)
MTAASAAALPTRGVVLLERAIRYALGAVQAVTPELLTRPTPCPDWDLRMLLGQVNDSLVALHEGIDTGSVRLEPPADNRNLAVNPVATFRDRARHLLSLGTAGHHPERVIAIADRPLTTSVVASVGAIELAVHGWDISRTSGHHQPIPPGTAIELLNISALVIAAGGRHPRFAAPVTVSGLASPSDRLVAFLGRNPGT